MYWADKVADEIISSGKYKPYHVDDMKTPSGRVHVGSLCGVMFHDFIYEALLHAGQDAVFTYLFEDHDPMDELPHYLPREKWAQYLGQPLFTIPSPDGDKSKNYAQYFSLEFQEAFKRIGTNPEISWNSDLYKTGKMNEGVRKCLDKVEVIREIYNELYERKLPDNWYPFKVVCPECGKMATTNVIDWDGEKVKYTCEVEAVDWTKGCGAAGEMSPFSGDGKFVGKLSWKVEWPVKWQAIGVTIEGAGKDHMSAGGSYDVAKLVCERVLNYELPYAFTYEFFLLGGRKMSSSRGLGTSAKEISETMPPYLVRFLFARTNYRQAIEFDPVGTMVIPDLFDEYDRCWTAYNTSSDQNLSRTFEMAQIDKVPTKITDLYLPRFRDVINYVQLPNVDEKTRFAELKKSALTDEEVKILEERINYAKIWLEKYAPDEFKFKMTEKVPQEAKNLSDKQKEFLRHVIALLELEDSPEKLQEKLYIDAKEMGLSSNDAFAAIYLVTIGKNHGPKAGWFLLQYPKEKVIERIKEAIA